MFWTSRKYGYDGAGNIKYINSTTYTYDKVSRLTVAGGETFTYDIFDNITNHTGSTISVDSNTNRLSSGATYDAAGNLATWNDPADSSTRTVTYQWDALGSLQHLTDNGTVAPNPRLGDGGTGSLDKYHVYTADDERVASVDIPLGQYTVFPIISLRYTLRGFGNELLSTFTLGTAPDGWQALYRTENDIWRGSQLAAIDTPTGIQHFALDHLGSPRWITDAAGNVASSSVFAPFGTGGVTGTTALQFTGHERDSAATADTLDYMHARFYTPGLGRFLSVDPARGKLYDPQSSNRYAYVQNNPSTFIDPTGRDTTTPRDDQCPADAVGPCFTYVDVLPKESPAQHPPAPPTGTGGVIGLFEAQYSKRLMMSALAAEKAATRLHGKSPDYVAFTANIAIPNPYTLTLLGPSGQVIFDRFGRVYLSVGPGFGKSSTGISGSATAGWMLGPQPTKGDVEDFITGWGANYGAGIVIGDGITWGGPGNGFALEAGIFSPQVGVSFGYTFETALDGVRW